MSMLLLQTFLLMLTAFFLGALVACLIKSTITDTASEVVTDAPMPRDLVVAQPRAQPAVAPASAAPPRPAPEPDRPRMETVARPAAAPSAPSPEAERFERALKEKAAAVAAPVTPATSSPEVMPTPAAKVLPAIPAAPAPVTATPVTIKPAAPVPASAVAVSVEPKPVVAAPAAPVAPAGSQPQPASPLSGAAGVGAAAAAAAALASTQLRVEPQRPSPNPPGPTPVMPVASGASGQSSVAAEVTMQPVASPEALAPRAATMDAPVTQAGTTAPAAIPAAPPVAMPAQDLTRIRSIDAMMQSRLNGFGVRRYDEIVGWSASDVNRFGTALGIGGRVTQENWIEQAQVLAKGGETDFSRKHGEAKPVVSKPTMNEGVRVDPTAIASASHAAPAAAAQSVSLAAPLETEPAKAVATPGTFTSLPFGQLAREPSAPGTMQVPAVATPAATAAATSPPAPATMELPRAGAQAAAAAAAAIAAAAAASSRRSAPPAAAVDMRDDLQRISGVNAEVEKLLNVQGVTRFAHIAAWTAADTERFTRLLGTPGRISRENWIEQAAVLAGSGAAYTRRDEAQVRGDADATRPARLVDAIRERESAAKAVDADRAAPRAGLSNLRSVRSEALRGDQPAVAAGIDDLKRIRGIGVLIEKKLNSLGVSSYEQVANWTGADIDRVSQILDFKGRIERENWVEQSRILASGGQTEFSRRVDKGDA